MRGTAETINVGRSTAPGHLTWYWTASAYGGRRHGLAASERLAWRDARAAIEELRRTDATQREVDAGARVVGPAA